MPHFTLEPELWRPVVEYEDLYEVSSHGRVRRIATIKGAKAGQLLTSQLTIDGYPQVQLWRNNKRKNRRVHQLVAEAFIGPCPPEMEVNHRDGNRANPHPSNLEYLSHADNCAYSAQVLRSQAGTRHHNAKLTDAAVRDIRKNCPRNVVAYRSFADRYGVSLTNIGQIVRGKGWQHVTDKETQ